MPQAQSRPTQKCRTNESEKTLHPRILPAKKAEPAKAKPKSEAEAKIQAKKLSEQRKEKACIDAKNWTWYLENIQTF